MSNSGAQRPITGNLRARLGLLLGHGLVARFLVWVFVSCIFPVPVTTLPLTFCREVLRLELRSSPPERHLNGQELTARVLLRLEQVERREPDAWMRDDIRIAWITVLECSRGNPQAFVDATYRVLGLHPSKVWPAIEARRAVLLGAAYPELFPGSSSPKKTARGVRSGEWDRRSA